MHGIAIVAEENTSAALRPDLIHDCGNSRIPSCGAVYRVITLPEHLLVQIEIRMGIIYVNYGKSRAVHVPLSVHFHDVKKLLSTLDKIEYQEASDRNNCDGEQHDKNR